MGASTSETPEVHHPAESEDADVFGKTSTLPDDGYVRWLESRSMLHHANALSDSISGKHVQWRNAYGHPRPDDFARAASVWFTSYPQAIMTRRGTTVLQTLGDEDLLSAFRDLGIEGIHTGPMKSAGGISGRRHTPTVDGLFDRIELNVATEFGTNDQYVQMTEAAGRNGIIVIGDLVPAHTGKGADFRLAERAYKNYEGIYTMVEIPEADWGLLGSVPDGADSVNLPLPTVQLLGERGYIPGPLEIVPFFDLATKQTNWSATDVVTGVDGRRRRWVYLHVFKAGQPSLNWLDPSLGAQRIVMADIVQSLHVLGAKGVRLDANPLMGVEGRPGLEKSWVEGHPLAEGGSNMIAMMVRKLGGYSFQEINICLEDLKRFSVWGADLSYDFITRPPYLYAMATGDAGPLRMVLRLLKKEGLSLDRFVHALQNHDELMFDLAHLRKHGDEPFRVGENTVPGKALYDDMYEEAKKKILDHGTSFIREFSNRGFCGTLVGYAAAACGISDPYHMSAEETSRVQQLHVLAAAFNAMQPGVFAISGWDLVGALPVPAEALGSWLDDQDYRWMNRGAFDLMGTNPGAPSSEAGLPKAVAVYGSLPDQLRDPSSFASQLKRMLRARKNCSIALSKLVSAPETQNQGLVLMELALEERSASLITVMNFGMDPVEECFDFPHLAGKRAASVFSTHGDPGTTIEISDEGVLPVRLSPLMGETFIIE